MGTVVSYVKGGVTIDCNTSTTPKPRPKLTWPIPTFPATNFSFLNLALEAIAGQGLMGVRVTNTASLPGSPAATWALLWTAYQGTTPPGSVTWTSVPITWPSINLLLTPAGSSTVQVYLQQVEAGQTYNYAQATITTPVVAGPNLLTPPDKPQIVADYQALLAEQPGIDAQALAALLVITGDGVTKLGTVVTVDGGVPVAPTIFSITGGISSTLSSPANYTLTGNVLTMTAPVATGTKVYCNCTNDGISALKTAYDNSISALTAYLNSIA